MTMGMIQGAMADRLINLFIVYEWIALKGHSQLMSLERYKIMHILYESVIKVCSSITIFSINEQRRNAIYRTECKSLPF